MVDFENQTVGPNPDSLKPITKIVVVYLTPFGYIADLGQAAVYVKSKGLDPQESLKPLAAVSNEDGYTEVAT